MGRDKGATAIEGRPMLDWVVSAAAVVGDPVVVGRKEDTSGAAAIPDVRDGTLGPLAGLEAALEYAAGREVALIAVDQPFVRPATLEQLLSLPGDAVVPHADARLQVTCAVYRSACLEPTREALDRGARSLRALLCRISATVVDEATWTRWGEDGRSWFSVDHPNDIEAGRRRFG
jgi:molybdopterin-guanine dinucleotide biosynthesis protein A